MIKRGFLLLIPFFIALTPLIYFEKPLDPVLSPQLIAFGILVIGLSIYAFKEISFNINILTLLFGGYVLFNVFSLFNSINPSESYYIITKVLLEFIFLIYSIKWISKAGTEKSALVFSQACQIACLAILISAFYQLFKIMPIRFSEENSMYSITSLLAHKNLFASILFMLLPWQIYGSIKAKGFWKIVPIINSIGSLFFIGLLQTRSVWIALILATFLTLMLVLIIKFRTVNAIKINKKLYFYCCCIAIAFLSTSAITYHNFDGRTKERLAAVFKINELESNPHLYTYKMRFLVWQKSMQMFYDNPWLGVGAGNWNVNFPKYGIGGLELDTAQGLQHYNRPHNDFLWVLSEVGIIGFLFYIGFFLLILTYVIKSAFSKPNLLNVLLFFFISGYIIISFVDFPRERIYHNMILLTGVAFIASPHTSSSKWAIKGSWIGFMGIIIGILAIIVGMNRYKGEVHTQKIIRAQAMKNWSLMEREAQKAESPFYKIDPMSAPIKWYEGVAAYALGIKDKAKLNFEEAYAVHPYHVHVLNNLGTSYEETEDHSKAILFYKKALAIAPQFEESILNLSAVYFNLGEIDSAYQTISKAYFKPENDRYRKYLVAILKAKIDQGHKGIQVKDLEKLRSDENLLINIFEKAHSENILFNQAILQSIVVQASDSL